ncbi:uncharacterized protein LOC134821940 [Bolinopsis microptera]|uniref:uncharacterized protein LOC134821940 n=1 Tax=Bolinopsis microptera TaxID=2820187 RepID=UPI003078AF63
MIRWMTDLSEEQLRAVNLFVILLLFSGFFVSSFLNPVILLYYNKNKSQKLSRKLFMLLSVSDFCTNSYPVLHILYFCVSPNVNFGVNTNYDQTIDYTFRFYAVPSLIMCTFGCLSQVTTSVLAIVRMISIFSPFIRLPQWAFLTYIAVYTCIMAINNFGFALCQFLELTPKVRGIIILTVDCCYWLNIAQCILGIVASLLTMGRIFSKRRVKDTRTRSCWIILLMNIPYCMSTINFILSKTNLAKYGYVYLSFVCVPSFTSMFNPLIIVFLNQEIRDFTHLLVTKGFIQTYSTRKLSRVGPDTSTTVMLTYNLTLNNRNGTLNKTKLEEKSSENF